MTSLLTNSAALTALTTLKSIGAQIDSTTNRVSTGQRVSSAADNAAYWSIATTLRTDNGSLSAVKDSLGLGSTAVDTAYTGLNNVLSKLQDMRQKLQTALQPGVDRSKVQTEISAIQSQMRTAADSSVASGQNWLSVNSSTTNIAYKATQSVIAGFSRDASGAITFSSVDVDVTAIKLYDVNSSSVTSAATAAQVTGETSLTGTAGFGSGTGTADFSGTNEVSIKLTLAGGNDTIVLNKASITSAAQDNSKVTTEEFLTALNNQIGASATLAGEVVASLDTQGRLTFTTVDKGVAATLKVENVTASTGNALIGVGFGTLTTTERNGSGTDAATTTARGILDTVGASTYSVNSINISGLVGTSGDTTLKAIITDVDRAIAKVTDAGTKLGAGKTQIAGQMTFVDTLMKANDRSIGILVDADVEEESTKLKALQTQQQLAVQSLSIANSASTNVLALFR